MVSGVGRDGLRRDVERRQIAAMGEDHPDVLLTRYNRSCIMDGFGDHRAA